MRSGPLLLAIGLAVTAATGRAQEARGPRAMAGASLGLAIPVGEFENFVDVGYGLGGFFLLNLDRRAVLGLRLDASGVIYGSQTRRRPLSETTPFVRVDVTTRNQIFWLGVGPQVTWSRGVLRPYANLGIGISYFSTESGVKGSADVEEFAHATNFDDLTFEWHSGGGLLLAVARGRTPVFLDFSLRHIQNG